MMRLVSFISILCIVTVPAVAFTQKPKSNTTQTGKPQNGPKSGAPKIGDPAKKYKAPGGNNRPHPKEKYQLTMKFVMTDTYDAGSEIWNNRDHKVECYGLVRVNKSVVWEIPKKDANKNRHALGDVINVVPNKRSKWVIDHKIILEDDFFEVQAYLNERDITHDGKDDVLVRFYKYSIWELNKEIEVTQGSGAKILYKVVKLN